MYCRLIFTGTGVNLVDRVPPVAAPCWVEPKLPRPPVPSPPPRDPMPVIPAGLATPQDEVGLAVLPRVPPPMEVPKRPPCRRKIRLVYKKFAGEIQ